MTSPIDTCEMHMWILASLCLSNQAVDEVSLVSAFADEADPEVLVVAGARVSAAVDSLLGDGLLETFASPRSTRMLSASPTGAAQFRRMLTGEGDAHFSEQSAAVLWQIARPKLHGRSIRSLEAALIRGWMNKDFESDHAGQRVFEYYKHDQDTRHLHSPRLRLSIKNDDLKILEAVTSGLQAAAGAGFFLNSSIGSSTQIAALVAIGVAVVKVIRSIRTKSARSLTPFQAYLLGILAASSPLSIDEVVSAAGLGEPTGFWTHVSVTEILQSLSMVRLRDGTIVAFVTQGADGRWSTAGV